MIELSDGISGVESFSNLIYLAKFDIYWLRHSNSDSGMRGSVDSALIFVSKIFYSIFWYLTFPNGRQFGSIHQHTFCVNFQPCSWISNKKSAQLLPMLLYLRSSSHLLICSYNHSLVLFDNVLKQFFCFRIIFKKFRHQFSLHYHDFLFYLRFQFYCWFFFTF